jgi:hypothetical protein
MVYNAGRAAADSRRRGGSVCTCWGWCNQSQQVHTEPPLLLESTAAQSVLYTIGVVVQYRSPDDGHDDARNMLRHQ